MDSPSQDGSDLGWAGRDSRHSMRRRNGVATWRQDDCRLASQDFPAACCGRCKKKEPGVPTLLILRLQVFVAGASG